MPSKRPDSLAPYRKKRRFERTPEPTGRRARREERLYAIQKHAARRLHYDLRLELDGVLKSWAVTRGPSLDPSEKRLAVRTEDHPVDYAGFEGRIPAGNYGAGTVLLWDRGTWEPLADPSEGLAKGKLEFRLHGERLKGTWALVRLRDGERKRENWLLIKKRDAHANPDVDVTEKHQTSVAGRREERDSGSLPKFVEPALATLVDEVPVGDQWLFELKLDGYRALAAVAGANVRIYTRNGLDWTRRYPAIASALADLNLPGVLLDGEVVVVDDRGRPDFGALQRAMKGKGGAMSYFAFDALAESGKSLRAKPLVERKERLKEMLGPAGRKGPVFYTDHIERDGAAVLANLCEAGFEGVIAKQRTKPYRSGRGRSWLKIKCGKEQEFVILGWSPSDRRRAFSSLLLGYYQNGALRYAGRIGSGFSESDLREISRRFRPIARSPISGSVPRSIARTANWVEPELVAQVAFSGFTSDGLVRQGRFIGLREDKAAIAVDREQAESVGAETVGVKSMGAKRMGTETADDPRLTHPDKVLYAEQGITKRSLANYLEAVADRMLPHLSERLVSLVRCPEGRARSCFFQRHGGRGLPAAFHEHLLSRPGRKDESYIYIRDREGLLAAAQMGVLELHIWGSRIDRLERPERLVFDLDPDPTVPFEMVKQAARRVRDVLGALDLQAFALLTGGKGIHVVTPIRRQHEWPTVKSFTEAIANAIAEDAPERYVATMSKRKRKGRIFIDYFRNDRAATAIAPYSTRKHAGAPVAWPVTWSELDGIAAASEVTMEAAIDRLARPDPWKDYFEVRQSLKAGAFRALGI